MANIKNRKKIATDSHYLRCHALLTALHFPLENTCSRKQDRKERYWRQQFWQMERDISVRPTEMTRPVTVDRPSKLVPNIPVGPNRNGPFHLMNQRKFPEFGVEWKAPEDSIRRSEPPFVLFLIEGEKRRLSLNSVKPLRSPQSFVFYCLTRTIY